MTRRYTEDTIGAENTFSDKQYVKDGFNFSLSGTWVATVHLQRSYDGGTTWVDVDSYTANTQLVGDEPEGLYWRFGVKTGNYTSGSVAGRISQ